MDYSINDDDVADTWTKQGKAKRVKQGPDLVQIETLESKAFYLDRRSTLLSTIWYLLKCPSIWEFWMK